MLKRFLNKLSVTGTVMLGLSGCGSDIASIKNGDLMLMVNNQLCTSIFYDGNRLTPFQTTESLEKNGHPIGDFRIVSSTSEGETFTFRAVDKNLGLEKQLTVSKPDSITDLLLIKVIYTNTSDKDIEISSWVNHSYKLPLREPVPSFWAFQGSSSGERADWITPLEQGYFKENFLGMNSSDYGGGIPVTDLWCREFGLAIGHASTHPELVSLPTEIEKYGSEAKISVRKRFEKPYYLQAGESLETLETFITVHRGDYYNGLRKYSELMATRGIKAAPTEPASFEPIWCAWGYGRDFTLSEVIGTLPKVKELGIKWAVLDDGFQQAEGDWHTTSTKFPKGDQQIKDLVKIIHAHGLKAKLWWAPLAADPGSKLLAENPSMRLYLADWAPQYITWWDAYYLSPTHPKTIQHTKETVNLFLNEWGFDGLKMDGQHMNAVAPDHNPESGLDDPEDATKLLPDFYKMIYETATSIKPDAVVENCPCGTCMSFFNMPFANQTVASDPLSSWQIRLKGKTYKALIPSTAYFGDHVELSDDKSDFASSFGIGAVLGTKFNWPANNLAGEDNLLTPENEETWKKWFSLYNQKMLSTGEYLGGLYDIGYTKPETHVIRKSDTLYYAFYAKNWSGKVEFRGVTNGTYEVYDYFNERPLGSITSSNPYLEIQFDQFLLAELHKKP